jgi:hypothetical protein
MFSTLLTVALFAAPAIRGVVADFAVNTPELVQCKSSKISWEKTTGPYNVIIVSPEDPCGDALVEIGDFDKSSIDWTTNLPAGTFAQVSVMDVNGEEAWSGNITVGDNNDESCLAPELRSKTASSSVVSASAASSSAAAAASSAAFAPASGTTLVVPPASASSASTPGGSVAPVGAANAGTNPFSNSGVALQTLSTPIMALSAIAAGIALCL